MGSSISPIFINWYVISISVFVFCLSNKGGQASREGEIQHHSIHVSSLLPAPVCSSSTQGKSTGPSLKVVHRHGPCSHFKSHKSKQPTATQFLANDQSRVASIQSKFFTNSDKNTLKASRATLPTKPGRSLGTGNYFVVVGLGTPQKQLSLIFDTGSDLTWTQCQPCAGSCYKQQEPIFDPSVSRTYRNLSCTSSQCAQLTSATGNIPKCTSTSTCVYGIQYGDQSFSVGFFGSETLTLTPRDVFPNFFFGCGQNNKGLFGSSAGLLGIRI